jgi:hypothetical protein
VKNDCLSLVQALASHQNDPNEIQHQVHPFLLTQQHQQEHIYQLGKKKKEKKKGKKKKGKKKPRRIDDIDDQ